MHDHEGAGDLAAMVAHGRRRQWGRALSGVGIVMACMLSRRCMATAVLVVCTSGWDAAIFECAQHQVS